MLNCFVSPRHPYAHALHTPLDDHIYAPTRVAEDAPLRLCESPDDEYLGGAGLAGEKGGGLCRNDRQGAFSGANAWGSRITWIYLC